MIQLHKIKFQNFLSYGNQWSELDLDTHKNTLLAGKNGHGKSTFCEALTYALYGKPYRNVNKPQLVNSIIGKNCLVELTFSIGKSQYLVRRGMKPNVFEIFKNDELIKQDSAMRDYQGFLENQILKMNYKTFCQIITLGSANYTPFMQLPAHSRRLIIEDLLDLQIFSSMNVLLKDRVSSNKEMMIKNDQNIKIVQSNLKLHESHLKEIQIDIKQRTKDLKNKIKTEESDVKKISKKFELTEKEIDKLNTTLVKYEKYNDAINKLDEIIRNNNKTKTKIKKELQFYESSCSCPTCRQNIDEKFKKKVVEKCNSKIGKIDSNLEIAESKKGTILKKLEKREKYIAEKEKLISVKNKLNSELFAKNTLIKSYNSDLENLKEQFEQVDTSKKEELQSKLEHFKKEKQDLIQHREVLQIASQLLKDGGIKTLIIRQYIPVINKIINQYLNHMNFFVEFNLDENFEETIKSRYRDEFSYNSFSEGEKVRINPAILFAWRAITKMRNSASCNLLIFDEVFESALDQDGTDDFLKILNSLTQDTNVFIISHKADAIADKFERMLRVEKFKNFSKITEE